MDTISITQERPDSPEARALIAELEEYLHPMYPASSQHGYSVEKLLEEKVAFFVLRLNGIPIGCAGVQCYGTEYSEIKRLFLRPAFRGRGLSKRILTHLENYSRARGIGIVRLETGILQSEAIGLYERTGYREIPAFGEYSPDPHCRFYEKRLPQAGTAQPSDPENPPTK